MSKINPQTFLFENEIDMRGREIDPRLLYEIGRNMVKRFSLSKTLPCIVTGGDSRKDTKELLYNLEEGILAEKGIVISVGSDVPKAVAYFAGELYNSNGVSYVTASHINAKSNGIKFKIFDRTPKMSLIESKKMSISDNALKNYEDYLINYFSSIGLGQRVLIDSLYGTSSGIAGRVFEKIGFKVTPLHDTLDRNFSQLYDQSPDPHELRNLEELMELAKVTGTIGFAFDGDSDRATIINKNGQKIGEDEITMIISEYLIKKSLQKKSEKPIVVYDIKCSNAVREVVEKSGGVAIMQKTGWQNIKRKMNELNALFGGEVSGHNFYGKEVYYVPNGDDGLFTGLMISKIIHESGKSLDELIASFPKYSTSQEFRIRYNEERNNYLVKHMNNSFSEEGYGIVLLDDDLRIEKYDSSGLWQYWMLVRTSKTEPEKLTIRFEGRGQSELNRAITEFKNKIPKDFLGLKEKLPN